MDYRPGHFVRRKSMRTSALGLVAVPGLALPASADTAVHRIQLAQAASDSGAQTGSNAGSARRGSQEGIGARSGDTARSSAGSAGARTTTESRRDGEQSRTSARANVRLGGDRHMTR